MRTMSEPFKVYHCSAQSRSSVSQTLYRSQTGSQISEFAAAILLLVTVIFVPMLDLSIIPIRWMMAQEIINGYVRTLALCESYTESLRAMEADPSLRTRLIKLGGVGVQDVNLRLNITRISPCKGQPKTIDVTKPGSIPQAWLPNGAFAPCEYLLEIDVQALISPAITMNWLGTSIPGLTAPIPVSLVATHEWPNLGKDPTTQKYFINE
jgi:hypothetical protein